MLTSLIVAISLAASPGPLVALSAKTGVLQDFPRVVGASVYAIEDDGRGGWFVGGEFASIGSVRCPNLAHVRADRTVDRGFCPKPDGLVRALARVGNTLYVGGEGMNHIAGARREALAAVDTATGRARPWNPGTPGRTFGVFDLSAGRGVLYVTGEFLHVGGKARRSLAAIGLATGRATRFAPNPDVDQHGDSAVATVVAGGSVYAWGIFSRAGGLPRDSFARLDPVTGHARPTVASPICPTALLASGPRLYAGTSVGCEASKGPLRALTLPDLTPVTWKPQLPHEDVEALGAGPGLLVAVSATSHFERGLRTVTGLDDRGRRVFTAAARPLAQVHTVAVGDSLVLVGSG